MDLIYPYKIMAKKIMIVIYVADAVLIDLLLVVYIFDMCCHVNTRILLSLIKIDYFFMVDVIKTDYFLWLTFKGRLLSVVDMI